MRMQLFFSSNSSWGHCGLRRLKSRLGVILQQTAGMFIMVLFLGACILISAQHSTAQHGTEQNMEEGLVIMGEKHGLDRVRSGQVNVQTVLGLRSRDLCESDLVDSALHKRICWQLIRIGHDVRALWQQTLARCRLRVILLKLKLIDNNHVFLSWYLF
jgi:hypothetical protein